MSMDRRAMDEQNELWIPTQKCVSDTQVQLAESPGHPFYRKLNRILARHGFDRFVEARAYRIRQFCARGSTPRSWDVRVCRRGCISAC
jgi:hypothetical protein